MLNAQLNELERSTIVSDQNGLRNAEENSIDIGFKLFPILESIAINILGKGTRIYVRELGYSKFEADLLYSMFRNGLLHTSNPYRFIYNNGEISWGLMASSGSVGFLPHFPGEEANKAFIFEKVSDGSFHASLSLSSLVARLRYDLQQREIVDQRTTINFIVGQRKNENIPTNLVSTT